MSETTFEPIRVELTKDQIGDLIYQQLQNDEGEEWHPVNVIPYVLEKLDGLGLLVRDAS